MEAIAQIYKGKATINPKLIYTDESITIFQDSAMIFAFGLTLFSGLSEPIGAITGYFVLRTIFSDTTFGVIFASVSVIMVYISLDELLPTAGEYGEHHFAIGGLILGMFIMALSLLFFE